MKKKLLSLLMVVAFVIAGLPTVVKADVTPGSWAFIIVGDPADEDYHVYDILNIKKGGAQQYDEFTFNYRNWEFKPTQDITRLSLKVKTESNPMIKTQYDKHTFTWRLEGEKTIEALEYNGFSEGASKTIHVIGNGTLKIKSLRYQSMKNEEGQTLYKILYQENPIKILVDGSYKEAAYESIEAFQADYDNIKDNLYNMNYAHIDAPATYQEGMFELGDNFIEQNTGAMTNEEYQDLLKYFDFDETHYQASLTDGYLVITGASDEEAKNIPMIGESVSSKEGYIVSDKEEFDSSYQSLKLEDISDQITEQQQTGIRVTGEKELIALYDISAMNDETKEEIKLKDGNYEVWIKLTDKMRDYLSRYPDTKFTAAYVENNEVKEIFQAEVKEDDGGTRYLVFTTTHFSNYAILGQNVEVTQAEKDAWKKMKAEVGTDTEGESGNTQTSDKENPKTSDPVMISATLFTLGLVGILFTSHVMKRRMQ